ncbi:MAG: ATP-binding protein [Pseudomonadota bacterium]
MPHYRSMLSDAALHIRSINSATPYLMSAALVAVVALAAHALTRLTALPHVSILFLAAVVASAAIWGFWPSLFAALLSIAATSFFFYSPIFSFRVADAQNVADLAVFVIVAAFTSRLAANAHARAIEARRQQQSIAQLLAFTERLAGSATDSELHGVILEHLAPHLGRPIWLLLPEEGRLAVAAALGDDSALPEPLRHAAERLMNAADAPVSGWRLELLATAQGRVGVLVAREPGAPADRQLAKALLGHAALAIERARLRREIADARLRAQGEALREALLNSVSHDLQTPLAAILGSASALESFAEGGDPKVRCELTAAIRDEAERLASYIENLLDLTRIRAGQIAPRLELVELADIVDAALRRKRKALEHHAVEVALPPDLPMLRLDLFLMEHALANVLDNAAKHTPAGSPVRIAARLEKGEVVLDVTDSGAGVPPQDLERIFEAFYRCPGGPERASGGAGLGLAICRAFVEANGGSVAALSAGPGRGTTLRMRLPLPEPSALAEAFSDD